MKKILFLFVLTILLITALGCTPKKPGDLPMTQDIEEESIDFNIEKIVLSKGYQSLSPNTEILKKGSRLKLLISPGLLEGSGVTIDNITKSGEEINIYIRNQRDDEKQQLSTPQILVEINDPLVRKLDELRFNIVSQNYEPISLKLDKNQILNKVYSELKIEPTSIPLIELNRTKDSLMWNISFSNVFNTEDSNFSLVNLDVVVDADSGEIIESIKDDISTYIDEGFLFDYIPHKALLYKQKHEEGEEEHDSLWIYNIETGERSNLYTSRTRISSAILNPNNELVSFIETDGEKSDIYMASISEEIAYKIISDNNLYPKVMKWADANTLYFLDVNDSKTTLFEYDIDTKKSSRKFQVNKTIEDFDIEEDKILLVEHDDTLMNRNIFLTKDGKDLNNIGLGFKASFLADGKVAYLQNIDKEDKNVIHIYDQDKDTEYGDLDFSITNYFNLDNNNLILTKKNSCNSDYILSKYNVAEGNAESLAYINSDKIFYDEEKALAYINITPPADKDEHNIIYSIDVNKLSSIEE